MDLTDGQTIFAIAFTFVLLAVAFLVAALGTILQTRPKG